MSRIVGVADERVLLVAPTRKDAATTAALLARSGIAAEPCATVEALLDQLADGAAALLLPEELITPERSARLTAYLEAQPAWSDLPLLVLVAPGADSRVALHAVSTLGNVTLLERPLRTSTLLSAVHTALRARTRQYQIREHLAERGRSEEALRLVDQRKDEFIATLGHELRNPLAPLQSGVQLLRLLDVPDPRLAQIAGIMERQVGHLGRLVDDLLEVSRITRGLIDVRRDAVDLAAVARNAIETCRPEIDRGGHTLEVTVPDRPITVAGDAMRLTQVLANLLTNAAKYTPRGGTIVVTIVADGMQARISVRDTGVGIAPHHLPAVFDMFMQVDRSTRPAQGGLGIGLTLVRSLVELHGGTVAAYSEGRGRGSEFVVTLPLVDLRVDEVAESGPVQDFRGRRMLIVDDNADAAHTLRLLLERLGASVDVAPSGRAALDRLASFTPDVVLLDIGMPDMDGYEVARRLRAMPGHGDTLLVALTGWGQSRDVRAAVRAGFDHHLVKPLDVERLHALLARA